MINAVTLLPNSIGKKKLEDLISRQTDSMKKSEGVLAIRISEGDIMSPGGAPGFGKILHTSWESLDAFMTWVLNQTPSEQADKDFLLENGAVLLYYEVVDLEL